MEITKEWLEGRLQELAKGEDQAFANLNAIGGAIQECKNMLKVVQEVIEDEKK